MALLLMIVRRMAQNKWLTLSLLSGLILTVALASSIPMYTDAILQRMLVKDLERLQTTTGTYPGVHYSKAYMGSTSFWDEGDYKPEVRPEVMKRLERFMLSTAAPDFGMPVRLAVREAATDLYSIEPEDASRVDAKTKRRIRLSARTGLYDHIRLKDGRLPAKEPVNGVYEALVAEKSLNDLNMVLGNTFVISDDGAKTKIKLRPVGVIDQNDYADPYWYDSVAEYANTFLLDEELFDRSFVTGEVLPAASVSWLFVLDYSKMDLTGVHRFVQTSERIDGYLTERFSTFVTDVPALATAEAYFKREADARRMLWSLHAPVLIMLALYLYMVANLIAELRKSEIAVLKSRGASRLQIVLAQWLEGLLLGAFALCAGPFVGLQLTKLLGASNGFLEFVDRSALPVAVTADSLRYAGYAVVCSVGMTLLPVFAAARATIVDQRKAAARRRLRSFWHRFYMDAVLIAVAVYGLRQFQRQRHDWLKLRADVSELAVDPLLFIVPALFIIGAGLFALRLYPYALRLIYRLGRSRWSPVLYSTLLQVGRSGTMYQFVMMFLIFTIATGLFSASAARTINSNTEHKIRYKNGADIVLTTDWVREAASSSIGGPPGAAPDAAAGNAVFGSSGKVRYLEPPFQPFTELPGVESAAKAFVKHNATFAFGKERGKIRLMGIDTAAFGRTAWLRDGLLDYHFYEYLNLIAPDPKAVLISRSMYDKGVKPGDTISVGWSGVDSRQFTVYGVIDYWPAFVPSAAPAANDGKPVQEPLLVVGHLDYIQMALAIEPYEVWIKLKEGASRQAFYDALSAKRIRLLSVTDTQEQIMLAKNDPFQLAINGVMTLGFLISAVICFVGFLLYWVLALTGRMLQYGVFRAIGVSFRQLVGMLVTEQVLTSVAAVFVGGYVGHLTSSLFVKLFQLSFDPAEQVPPFKVTFDPNDSLQLYIFISILLIVGLAILGLRVSRIKLHQAIKLGED
ncbi:ABC transporter permease [Paenibacillus thermotolerans]|uniref:ABC transporter permease n=1 Tax=Paenibacillus thermotolerans TaxID=3027807 RepID=UPI0023675FFF|nr:MULTISPECIES: FtsX-like permease family protein [unclassified Paenibacillus]